MDDSSIMERYNIQRAEPIDIIGAPEDPEEPIIIRDDSANTLAHSEEHAELIDEHLGIKLILHSKDVGVKELLRLNLETYNTIRNTRNGKREIPGVG